MKNLFVMLILSGVLAGVDVIAQERKHEEHKEEKKAPAKADGMKCCEGMEKMGEMKQGMPIKGDMKAKMQMTEKMKEMKEKMADKMKDMKVDVKPSEPSKDEHQH